MRSLVSLLVVCTAVLWLGGAPTRGAQDVRSRDAEPDYGRVFNQDVVNRLDIRMAARDWQAILADMQSMAGPSGLGLNVPFSADQLAACSGRLEANACTAGDHIYPLFAPEAGRGR